MTEAKKWNPRYVSYAIAHGERDPQKMIERDKAAHPTACMAGYIAQSTLEWAAWDAEHPGERREPCSQEFTDWQRARAEATAAELEG